MIKPLISLSAMTLALSGCGSGPRPAAASAPARSSIVVVPQVMSPAGLDGVIGTSASELTRRFGEPRLDMGEGDARKLQFAGSSCVLDIYLYPVTAGGAPTAAHVEARLRQGGAAVDQGTCIREVESQ